MTGPMTAVDSKQQERDITGQLLFSALLPQDSIHDNNVQLKQKKATEELVGCGPFPAGMSFQAGNSESLGEITQVESALVCFSRDQRTPDSGFSRTAKIHQKAAAATNSLISSVTSTLHLEPRS